MMPVTAAPARNGGTDLDEPGGRECLLCYLHRMLASHGCDNTKRWTVRWRDRRAPGNEMLIAELEARGGLCCDCEVVMNVWDYDGEDEEVDTPTAGQDQCLGVRTADPLTLCACWSGAWLRDPHYEDEDDDYEKESYDYDM
jgi:hypothetical protein